MTNVITASAAIAAALFSFVNVLVSTRSTRTIEDRKWRRETARRSMHDFLNAVDKLHQVWLDASVSAQAETFDREPIPHKAPHLYKGEIATLSQEPRRHLEELELIATPRCIKASQKLMATMTRKEFDALLTITEGTDRVDLFKQWMAHTEHARQEFITACRADLGAGRRVQAQTWRYGGWLR